MPEELLERVLHEIRQRRQALRTAVEESARLERALAALGSEPGAGSNPVASGSGAPRRSSQRRRAARGANRQAILALVRERPGVTAGEVSGATGIARSTVSPTLSRLAAAGAIERVELPSGGVGFRSASTPPSSAAASQRRERPVSPATPPEASG